MKRYVRNKKVTVWILAALWVFLFAVKSAHIHTSEEVGAEASDTAHHHTPCDDCPICQFALSFDVATPASGIEPLRTFVFLLPASPQEKPYSQSYLPINPRAPPVCGYNLM
jgi:hypothetical protein